MTNCYHTSPTQTHTHEQHCIFVLHSCKKTIKFLLHTEVRGEKRTRQQQQEHREADVDAIENEDEQLQTAWNHAHDLEPWVHFYFGVLFLLCSPD